ncbi:DEAD/DEAH box helicase [Microbacterium sp.]|uniref:DEAD/DEAH box helicase n=1 Tax=Microbacterium sp. TaxID=51671 RepID=UPI0025E3B5E6|nr:DEAD/DEAH box helicase [Microbacterium sp.]
MSGPSWRDLLPDPAPAPTRTPLALGVELRRRSPFRAGEWAPRRVDAVTPRGLATGRGELLVGLRPLMASASTGEWVKGDVSWDAVRRPGTPFDPVAARWLAELYSIAHDVRALGSFTDTSEWITLDTVESALLWPHLARGTAAGVAFVPTKPYLSIDLATSATIVLEIGPGPRRGLSLRPRTTVDGEQRDADIVRPVAQTGVYVVAAAADRISLTLAPVALSDPTLAALHQPEGIEIPAAEASEFLRDAYPRLARRAVVTAAEGVRLPDPPPPQLVVAARFGSGDAVQYAMEWEYPGVGRLPYATGSDPDRDAAGESAVRARVERAWTGASDLPFSAVGTLRGADTAEFSARILPVLERARGVRVEIQGRRRPYEELSGAPEITITTVDSPDPDWFDLGVIVRIDGRSIPFTPLFTALAQRRKRMLLSDGRYFSLAHPALDRLRDLIDEAGDVAEWETGPRISRYQIAMWADFEDLADVSEPAVAWRATAAGLRDADGVEATDPPRALRAELRPYQRAGFDWLSFLWRHRLGGVLADDMGLGKTLQLLALIAHARETGETRPFLVVAPTSVVSTWRTEAARFLPDLRVAAVDATRRRRDETVADAAARADVIVTSYALLRLAEDEFAAVGWAGLVLDEAQFVKNPRTRLHRAAAAMRADVTYAVTGTPLENGLAELWAILSLTSPGLFPSARRFREEYIGPIEHGKVPENQEGGPFRAGRVARLRHRIRPFVLRRTKEQVATELPPRQEQELVVELAPAHRLLYDTILQRERQKILGLLDDLDRQRFIVFRSLTLLRLLSLAPVLIDPEQAHIPSAKLDALLEQLDEVVAEGHRALVFSQFTSFLDLAERRLDDAGIRFVRLDGSTRRRDDVIDAFRAGDAPVFLISLKAGGFGLTLTEADYVFLLDPWWNPAAEAQAVDRTHRIGQTRRVMVYRMIAEGTIEQKVMALQGRKARLFRSVMDDDDLFARSLTADDLRGLFEE